MGNSGLFFLSVYMLFITDMVNLYDSEICTSLSSYSSTVSIHFENKRFIYTDDGKQGIKDFDGNTIIPAAYYEIHGLTNPYLTVRVGEKDNFKEGLITARGQVVVSPIYKRIGWCKDQRHFFCCSDGHCEMYCIDPIIQ